MKKIFLILVTLFIIHIVNAQENFQGEITYVLHASIRSNPDATLKIFFGKNKIKLRFKEREDYDKEELLVLFDSSAKYVVNTESKTYRKKPLIINSNKQYNKKTVAGYNTTASQIESNGFESLFGGTMQKANIVFYVADSLYYTIPAAFKGNAELVAIQNNKIVLGMDIQFKNDNREVPDTAMKEEDIMKAEAVEIKPMILNDSEFNIPADYISKADDRYEPQPADSAISTTPAMADTTVIQYPEKKKAAKKPVKSNKSKTVIKPSAARKKE